MAPVESTTSQRPTASRPARVRSGSRRERRRNVRGRAGRRRKTPARPLLCRDHARPDHPRPGASPATPGRLRSPPPSAERRHGSGAVRLAGRPLGAAEHHLRVIGIRRDILHPVHREQDHHPSVRCPDDVELAAVSVGCDGDGGLHRLERRQREARAVGLDGPVGLRQSRGRPRCDTGENPSRSPSGSCLASFGNVVTSKGQADHAPDRRRTPSLRSTVTPRWQDRTIPKWHGDDQRSAGFHGGEDCRIGAVPRLHEGATGRSLAILWPGRRSGRPGSPATAEAEVWASASAAGRPNRAPEGVLRVAGIRLTRREARNPDAEPLGTAQGRPRPVGRGIRHQTGRDQTAAEGHQGDLGLDPCERGAHAVVQPPPKPKCWLSSRSGSKRSGSRKRAGSRLAAAKSRMTGAPLGGMVPRDLDGPEGLPGRNARAARSGAAPRSRAAPARDRRAGAPAPGDGAAGSTCRGDQVHRGLVPRHQQQDRRRDQVRNHPSPGLPEGLGAARALSRSAVGPPPLLADQGPHVAEIASKAATVR